jgi:hypothetical protein
MEDAKLVLVHPSYISRLFRTWNIANLISIPSITLKKSLSMLNTISLSTWKQV